jgi:hypothetical protein
VLVLVARLLPGGTATGIDLWRTQDQSGNAVEATWRNAEVEGVADRASWSPATSVGCPLGMHPSTWSCRA